MNALNPMNTKYIISDTRKDTGKTFYVCAPPGFALDKKQMRIYRDCTCPLKSGPEWTDKKEESFLFKTHRAAMRVRNKTISGKVIQSNQ